MTAVLAPASASAPVPDPGEVRDPGCECGPASASGPASGSVPDRAWVRDQGCECGRWFQHLCGHGNWVWCWAPGDKWSCPACCKRRMRDELVPEIMLNLAQAREKYGWTLKLLTATWIRGDLGAQPTAAGAKRRAKDWGHLMQQIKRHERKFAEDVSPEHPQGRPVPYMKVAETHRSGAVHFHALAVIPFIKQSELGASWKIFARGATMIDIRAVGIRCARCWPGRKARPGETQAQFGRRKRRSMIFPGGKCRNCGYGPVVSDEEVAWAVAEETVKYITKQFGDGWDLGGEKPNRITKSTTWLRVPQKAAPEEGESGACEDCDDYHRTEYVGCAGQVEKDFPGITGAWEDGLAFYPPGGAPCLCWGEGVKWRRSEKIAEFGLGDLVGRGPSE